MSKMDEDHRNIIKKSIQDALDFKDEYSTWHIESDFQLLLAQDYQSLFLI